MSTRTIRLRVKRQAAADSTPYWEEFEVPYKPQHNVISVLMEVRTNPVTAEGERVPAPAWEASCLEEVCGSCAMRINGRVRMACTLYADQSLTVPDICRVLRISQATFYRYVALGRRTANTR